ncbi:MAG TPA: hypothetical protein VIW73_09000 [Candidatus Cybelea sp.]
MLRKFQGILAIAVGLQACSGGASTVSAPMGTSFQAERVVAGAASARWKPAEISVALGSATLSRLKFSNQLQAYDLSQSCSGNAKVEYTMQGGSIGRRFEIDTWSFTDAGSQSGTCTVTAKFRGSHVRAKLAVTVH